VRFEKIYGMPVDVGSGPLTLGLGDLRAETRRRIMVRVKTSGLPVEGSAKIRAILTYDDRVSERAAEHEILVEAAIICDDVEMMSSLRPEVMARVQEAIGLRAIRQATRDYARGDQRGATERLEKERSRLADVVKRFSLPKRAMAPISAEVQDVSFGMERAAPSSAAGRSLRFERSQRDLELERGEAAPGTR